MFVNIYIMSNKFLKKNNDENVVNYDIWNQRVLGTKAKRLVCEDLLISLPFQNGGRFAGRFRSDECRLRSITVTRNTSIRTI